MTLKQGKGRQRRRPETFTLLKDLESFSPTSGH